MQTWAQITEDFHRNWPIYVAMPFVAALIGSLIYSVIGMVIDVAMERLFSRSSAA